MHRVHVGGPAGGDGNDGRGPGECPRNRTRSALHPSHDGWPGDDHRTRRGSRLIRDHHDRRLIADDGSDRRFAHITFVAQDPSLPAPTRDWARPVRSSRAGARTRERGVRPVVADPARARRQSGRPDSGHADAPSGSPRSRYPSGSAWKTRSPGTRDRATICWATCGVSPWWSSLLPRKTVQVWSFSWASVQDCGRISPGRDN